jgi:hypothetical protein
VRLSNNSACLLPPADLWAMAVLDAPVSWWFARRPAQHGKDGGVEVLHGVPQRLPHPDVKLMWDTAPPRQFSGGRSYSSW